MRVDIIIIMAVFLGIGGLCLLASFIGAWLWNITLPYIFGLPEVAWWHILALMILLWILLPGHIIKIGNKEK